VRTDRFSLSHFGNVVLIGVKDGKKMLKLISIKLFVVGHSDSGSRE
jgi:hypothetical protein